MEHQQLYLLEVYILSTWRLNVISIGKGEKTSWKTWKKIKQQDPVNSDRILRKDFPEITDVELKKLKIDESYKEGFLLAIRLVASELKTIVDKKWMP